MQYMLKVQTDFTLVQPNCRCIYGCRNFVGMIGGGTPSVTGQRNTNRGLVNCFPVQSAYINGSQEEHMWQNRAKGG